MECPLIPLSDINVLLVDDERVSRLLVGNTLRRCGYQVSTAAGGEEAIQELEKNPGAFSLILSDVMMPGIDGVQLLKYVRGNTLLDDVPVVMVSANEHESTVFECISNGAEDYLLKPVTKKEVQYIWQHVWRRQAANSSPTEDWIPEANMVRSNQRTGVQSPDGNSFDVSNPQLLQPQSTCTPNSGAKGVKSQPSGGVSGAAIGCDSGSSMPMSGRPPMGPPTRLPIEESKGGLLGDSLLAQGTTGASGSAAVGPEVNRYAEIKGFKKFCVLEQPDECVRQQQQGFQGTMPAVGKGEFDMKRGARSGRPLLTPKAWFPSNQGYAEWPPKECPEGWVNAARVAETTTAAPLGARGMEARPSSSLDERASGYISCSRDGLMGQQMASKSWESGEQTPRPLACPRLPAPLGLQSSVEGKGVQAWSDFTGGIDRDEIWAVRQEAEEARQQLAMEHRQRLHLQSRRSGKQWRGLPDEMQQYPELKRQQWLYASRSNSELKSLPSLSHSQQSQPGQSQHMEVGRAQIALNDQQLLLEQTQQMLNLCQEQGEELHRHKLFNDEDAELDEMEHDGFKHGEFQNRSRRSCSVGEGSHMEKDRVQGSEQGWEDGEWNPHSVYGGQCQRQQRSVSRETGQCDGRSSRLFGASAEGSRGVSNLLDGDDPGRMGRGSRMSGGAQIGTRLDERVERPASSQDVADTETGHFDEATRACRESAESPDLRERSSAEAGPLSEGSDSPKPGLSESAVGSPSGSRSGMEGRLIDAGGGSLGGRSLSEKAIGVVGSGMTLRQWLHRPGRRVDRRESLQILLQVVRMLSAMHAQGICSLKVRPSKLFLSSGKIVSMLETKSMVSGVGQGDEKNAKVWHGRPLQVAEPRRGTIVRGGEAVVEKPNGDGGLELTCHGRRKNEGGCVSVYGAYRGEGRDAGVLAEDGSASWRIEAGSSGERSQELCLWRAGSPGLAVRGVRSQSGGGLWRGSGSEGGRSGSGKCSGRIGASSGQKSLDEGERRRRVAAAEQQWYSSPEELSGGQVSPASDMYSLGVFFFELLCPPMRLSDWARVMADLRHRILPPTFLSERPKEAAFCLWLLHPEPSSRPKARDVLGCDLMSESVKIMAEQEAEADLEEEGMEMEVLHDFLVEMQCGKKMAASRLEEDLQRLTADINEIHRRRTQMRIGCPGESSGGLELASARSEGVIPSLVQVDNVKQTGRKRFREQRQDEESLSGDAAVAKRRVLDDGKRGCISGGADGKKLEQKCERVMNNFDNLEEAYFSTRWKLESRKEGGGGSSHVPGLGHEAGAASGLMLAGEDVRFERGAVSESTALEGTGKGESADWLGCFFDSLCKFARYSKFEVKATLRHGDLLSTSNMVCSLSLDKDEEYFASAGVCKRVKIFGLESVLSDGVGIHYPVAEMASRSKLSCICWNSYIKSHIISSDYEGHVQLWDASTGQPVVEYEEHEKRAWSVDFSRLDPKHLASGSDDGTVKLWSINQESSVATIKTKANVCCVQFSPDSAYTLAFGSADYKVYTYDWRHTRSPLAVFSGHRKAVSYVKFVDANTFVSASTDNTLKLWDLQEGIADSGSGLTTTSNACIRTYTGHTNEKNFVGLTVADGYIACGSETNSVFSYHRSLPMPMASHQFGSTDPVTGTETDDDGGQFVSSVCWRGSTQTLVAANSMGNIKILEMV